MAIVGDRGYLVNQTCYLRGALSDGANNYRGRSGQSRCTAVRISVASSRKWPCAGMAALMLAAFTMVVGHGVVPPLLPYHIDWLSGASVEVAQVSRHMGLLTAVYTFSLFLFAPMWGRLASRCRLRGSLLSGLTRLGASRLYGSHLPRVVVAKRECWRSSQIAALVDATQFNRVVGGNLIARIYDVPGLTFNFWYCTALCCLIPLYAIGRFPVGSTS